MNEFTIIENVISIALSKAKENNLSKINKVTLIIGELTDIMNDALLSAFQRISKDTILEGAELVIENVEATANCEDCQLIFKIDHFNKLCPSCKTFCGNILTGYELYVDTIEGD